MASMENIEDLVRAFGGNAQMARMLNHPHSTRVSEWKRTGNIPVEHWPAIIAAGKDVNLDLSAELLMAICVGPSALSRASVPMREVNR
jgi:hypothetical protein